MTIEQAVARHALTVALEEAIRSEWATRTWYQTTGRAYGFHWTDLEAITRESIRRHVRHLRRVRAAQ